ncbi:TraB/GumN family protein [Bacillus aquiflavi]|uniref:TraB/GumN family protein n=1 Tax=Bacillus aquiflavi TaxID=2672567 RepID=UPI001CA97045|nr:TraB/GumN family protein [Bacillus aquiflavi]UAC49537.1 TraB/GumN family protein [Bacillus aquiflavi]
MKKLFNVLLMLLVLVFSMTACSTTEEAEQKADEKKSQSIKMKEDQSAKKEQADEKPGTIGPFWKITHNDNVVYMLGSIHVATEDFYPLHEKIETAFDQSTYLAVEADIFNMNQLQMQKELEEKAKYADGKTLQADLPADLYSQLKSELQEYGINISMLNEYETWYISMVLEGLQAQKLGYDSELGIDYHFLKKEKDDKEIIELEGVTFQLDLFDQLSPEIQKKLIEVYFAEKKTAKENIEKLVTAWKSGNAEQLSQVLLESEDDSEEYKQFNEVFMDQRNKDMAVKIEEFLNSEEKGTYFVIVGAAHFVGENGIVNILQNKGFTVEEQF